MYKTSKNVPLAIYCMDGRRSWLRWTEGETGERRKGERMAGAEDEGTEKTVSVFRDGWEWERTG